MFIYIIIAVFCFVNKNHEDKQVWKIAPNLKGYLTELISGAVD